MPPNNKDDYLKIRISDDLKDAVKSLAKKRGETMAVVVRDALRKLIHDDEYGSGPGNGAPESLSTAAKANYVPPTLEETEELAAKLSEFLLSDPATAAKLKARNQKREERKKDFPMVAEDPTEYKVGNGKDN